MSDSQTTHASRFHKLIASRWVRKVWQLAEVVIGVAVVNFILLRLAPGDAVQVIAGEAGSASPEYIAALRQQLGLDQPLYIQFAKVPRPPRALRPWLFVSTRPVGRVSHR
jgi:hypothetical protein